MQKTILQDTSLNTHILNYLSDRESYVNSAISVFSDSIVKKSVTTNNKAKTVATLLHNLDKSAWKLLIPYLQISEVLSAAQILDANRQIRQLEKYIESNHTTTSKQRRKIQKKKNLLIINKNYVEGVDAPLSLSLSKIRMITTWVQSLKQEDFITWALLYPNTQWKELADLCHFNPSNFDGNWYLQWCFGKKNDNIPLVLQKLWNMKDSKELISIYDEYELPYDYIRLCRVKLKPNVWSVIKWKVATKEKLRTVLWWWKELNSETVNQIIADRLNTEITSVEDIETFNLPYSAVLNILLQVNHLGLQKELTRVAELLMEKYVSLDIDSPVVVFGDASSSMEVAIRSSSILTSLLCYLTKANLHLFRNCDEPITNPPTDVKSALSFAKTMRAKNCTSPASSLFPYLSTKKIVKTFIIVTDEEENTDYKGVYTYNYTAEGCFAKMYKKYIETVYPARLVFISFATQKSNLMTNSLQKVLGNNYNELVDVYKFDQYEPDMSRFDRVLHSLAN